MTNFRAALAILLLACVTFANAGPDGGEEEGCDLAQLEGSNLGLAIASIFIIFSGSLIGACLPALLTVSARPIFEKAVKTLAYAGAGVLLATGFMHLLLPAQAALTSECLSESWLNRYPSWAFLFCVISIALMQVLDYFVTVKIAGKAPPSLAAEEPTKPHILTSTSTPAAPGSDSSDEAENGVCTVHTVCKDDGCSGQTLLKPSAATVRSQLAAVFLSEVSIAIHSVLIGITLGVTNGDEIVPLLIALTFHQFLEGVAIGTAAVYAGMKLRVIVILGLIFAVTTPIGTAIGIGVRQSYNTNSPGALLTQGILDAIGAGMLIFLALGDHVNAVKSQAHWLKSEGMVTHGACIGAFLAGVAVMCTIALWV